MEARTPDQPAADQTAPRFESLQLLTEELVIDRRSVAGETVRVSIATEEHAEVVDETLHNVAVEVEHVPVGRYVDAVPPVREEGDVTILPVVEEVLVVERRLLLREEIHVRRVRSTHRHIETIVLRTQHPTISRHPATTQSAEMSPSSTIPEAEG